MNRDLALFPRNSSVDADGVLSIGGVPVHRIAAEHGTPVFIYDEEHLRHNCREAVRVFGEDSVIYATKAFLCMAMARLAHEEGLLLDVATGGELHVALRAGVPGGRCVFHGNNKSREELSMAIDAGVRHIIVDSFDECDRIEELVAAGATPPRVQIRVTPGVHVHTHEYVATGQDDSKFGFNLNNGDAHKAIARVRDSDAMELVGIHCHIGSNVFDVDNFEDAWNVMVDLFAPLGLPEITMGGGLGVAYTTADVAPSMGDWAAVLTRVTARLPRGTKVYVEPGRSIVAAAAVTAYTVGTVKDIDGIRRYVAVDGGMSDNPRPMMYSSAYEIFHADRMDVERSATARVVGKHCESGDILIMDASIAPDVAVGELMVVPVTGAYGHSMASNYNKVPRPPVVFVADGRTRVVVRRETLEDLVRLDQ